MSILVVAIKKLQQQRVFVTKKEFFFKIFCQTNRSFHNQCTATPSTQKKIGEGALLRIFLSLGGD